jgi:hypothetical protein
MSFISKAAGNFMDTTPGLRKIDFADQYLKREFAPKVPTPPGVPNPNDALNASQSLTDSMRMRRGMLANIYAGGQPASAPVTGKVTLGS